MFVSDTSSATNSFKKNHTENTCRRGRNISKEIIHNFHNGNQGLVPPQNSDFLVINNVHTGFSHTV